MTDPSQPLQNARHEVFAQTVAKGQSATQAYKDAGYAAKDADANATRLMGNDGIKARVEWLLQQAATDTVLSIKEKREFLAAIVRTPIGEIGPDSPLCQEYVRTQKTIGRGDEAEEWDVERIKAPSKLDAIKIDNDLAGDSVVPKIEVVIRHE